MKQKIRISLITAAVLLLTISICSAAFVVRKGGRVYIEDRKGELWDVTEAKKRGFKPHRFEYGLGKDAIAPLGDEDLKDEKYTKSSRSKVLGVTVDKESHAYSIERLVYHEIANTTISGKAIAAGY